MMPGDGRDDPSRDHEPGSGDASSNPDDTRVPDGPSHSAFGAGTVAPGTFVGPYKLLRYIDEGAMGEVWMAERRDTFRQKVALKLLTASASALARRSPASTRSARCWRR